MKTILVIIAPAPLFGVIFWCLWGHDFEMSVSTNYGLWYVESIDLPGRILASLFFGLTASAIVAAYLGVRIIVHKIRKDMAGGTSINPTDY